MRGNQRSCRCRGARLRSSTETFQICTSLSERPESPRAISSAMMAKVWVSVPFSSSTPPNSSGTPSVRMPTFCAPSRISGGSRASGRMSHSRCQLPRMNGITTSSTKSRQLCRIMRCSSDRPVIAFSLGCARFALYQRHPPHPIAPLAAAQGVLRRRAPVVANPGPWHHFRPEFFSRFEAPCRGGNFPGNPCPTTSCLSAASQA